MLYRKISRLIESHLRSRDKRILTNFSRSLHLLSEAKGGDEWRWNSLL